MKIAKAGWPVVTRSLIGAVIGALLTRHPEFGSAGWWLLGLGLAWAAFAAFFFRDPDRPLPSDHRLIYSPGDGTVLSIAHETMSDEVTVRIFLSIFNVHLQRAPCSGTVQDAEYFKGGFKAAMSPKAKGNERCVIKLLPEGRRHPLVVEQIAGLIARRIECWVGIGDKVLAGERYGMIHYGSQVAVTLPGEAQVLVSVGDPVRAGLTPIARWTS